MVESNIPTGFGQPRGHRQLTTGKDIEKTIEASKRALAEL